MLLEYHEHDADGGVAQSLWSLVFITGKVEEKLLAQLSSFVMVVETCPKCAGQADTCTWRQLPYCTHIE